MAWNPQPGATQPPLFNGGNAFAGPIGGAFGQPFGQYGMSLLAFPLGRQ